MSGAGFEGTNVLVVGGAGFVGSNLTRALVRDGARIHIVDNLLSAERTDVLDLPEVSFTEASITDDAVLSALDDAYDYAFHLATYHGNQSSMHDPLADHQNNTLTSLKLFQRLSKLRKLKRVVYSSAGCTVAEKVYGDAKPTTEDDPVSLHLDSPYQISKIVGEMYANYFHAHDGLPVVIARFQNVYGPGEILGAGAWRGTPATVWRNVTPTFVYRAIKGLPLLLENEGRSSRDFIYVDDIVRGLILCSTHGDPGEVYNLASGVETTIRELADAINTAVPTSVPLELGPRRLWDHSGNRLGSTAKASEQLGFSADVDLHEGIRRTVEWTTANLAAIDAAIDRHRQFMTSA
jgi:nucleoside-diphosphate-sugar epimerase